MDKLDRIFALHQCLHGRRTSISIHDLAMQLNCGPATVKRDIRFLREHFHAPIEFDVQERGYRYAPGEQGFTLPGLWLTGSQLQALLTLQQMLNEQSVGLLETPLAPARRAIDRLLKRRRLGTANLAERIQVLAQGARPPGPHFNECAAATLQRHRLRIEYLDRGRNSRSTRDISPQRLIRYREN